MPNNIILMADDDPDDRLFTYEASAENHFGECLHYVEDGEELLDYLYHRGKYRKEHASVPDGTSPQRGTQAGQLAPDQDPAPRPSIILLDLNMPKVNGLEVLKRLKADPELRTIPIIVMTTSSAEEDLLRSYDLGASSFISKPTTFEKLVAVMRSLEEYWFKTVKLLLWVEESNLKA